MEKKKATRRQLFALFLASKNAGEKKDFRGMDLSFEEASELLNEYNQKSGYKPQREFKVATAAKIKKELQADSYKSEFITFFKEKYLDRMIAQLGGVLKQVSVIENDLNPKGKKYIFFGSGCSVGTLKFRKCEKYETIYSACRKALRNECLQMIFDEVGQKTCKKLERFGAPLGAIVTQDYEMNQLGMSAIKEFLEQNGAKKVEVQVWYD